MATDPASMNNSAAPSFETRLSAAIRSHNDGVAGNKEAVKSANDQFRSLSGQYPDNVDVKAYYGSVLALMARDANKPAERLGLAKQGLELLDEAVAAAPDDRTYRMLRGKIAYRVPEQFFQRTETAIEDYAMLIDYELQNPGSLADKTYATIVYELGDAYYRTNRLKEARLCWSMLTKLTGDEKLLALVKTKKKSLSRKINAPENNKFEIGDWAGILIGLAGASLLNFTKRK